MHYLLTTNADNVGGFRESRAREDTLLGRAIALSIGSVFGSGGAVYRTGAREIQWVDTVFCGAYRKTLFGEIGLFDERLMRGQDREFNERLRRSGRKVLFVPDIRRAYYARSDLRGFIDWIFDGGLTPFYISRVSGYRIWSWRNLVPLAFLASVTAGAVLSWVEPDLLAVSLVIPGLYLSLSLIFSIRAVLRSRDVPMTVPDLMFVFLVTHVVYGFGSIVGVIRPIRGTDWVRS